MRKITVFEKGRSCRLWHRWQHVLDNGYTKYFECKDCGARQSRQPEEGYQPVDIEWLTRGSPPTADDISFLTDEERFEQQAEAARSSATELLSDLGLDVTEEMLTAEGFRAVFDDLFGALTPEMTAILIEAGVAVSYLIDAENQ